MPDDLTDQADQRTAAASAYGVAYGTGDNSDPPEPEGPERDRRLPSILGLVLLIVVAILIFMLSQCGASNESSQAGGKSIEPVENRSPLPGTVSVWITPGTTIDAVLSAARIRAIGRTNMGGGRWVVRLREGAEERAVSALQEDAAVYDAGLVYSDPTLPAGEAVP